MSRPVLVSLGLAAVLVLGAFLRLSGNDYLLPLHIEPDAHIPVQVTLIETDEPEPHLDANFGKYPHLVAWTTVAFTDPPPEVAAHAPLEAHLERAKDPVLRVRTVVGWLSLLAVVGTWLLARGFVGPSWGLAAAGMVATSLLAVHFGAQSRPHGAAVGFSTLTLWACVVHARRGGWGSLLLVSACFCLALGTLQSALALGFPVLVAHLVAARRAGAARWWALGGRRAGRLVLPVVAIAVAALAFAPFFFAESQGADGAQVELNKGELEQAGHKLIFDRMNGRGFAILAGALWRWEPVLTAGLLLALAVFAVALFSRGRPGRPILDGAVVVLLSFAVPYLAVCGTYERVYERFLLPVLPLLALFVTWSLRRLALAPARGTRVIGIASTTAVLVLPALVTWRLTEIRREPPTQALAARWLEKNAEPSDRVLVTRDLKLPLFKTYVSDLEEQGDVPTGRARDRIHWIEYQHHVLGPERPEPAWNLVWMPVIGSEGNLLRRMNREPAWYVDQQFGDWLVAMLFDHGRIAPGIGKVHRVFRERGEVLYRFSPDGDLTPSGHPLAYQDETCPGNPSFAWRVLNAVRMGPVIEILRPPHRLPPAKRE